MNSLRQLRRIINCTISQAKQLLETADDDMEQAISLYHQCNIEELIKTYNCPKEMAERHYHATQNDMVRTKDIIAKTMEQRRHL